MQRYLVMRRKTVEPLALTAACQLGAAQRGGSVDEARGQGSGARSSGVEPPGTAASRDRAGAERYRPGREDTGTDEPGGRPEPQDQTKHFAAVEIGHGAVE